VVEDEGEYIGSVGLPPELIALMRAAPHLRITDTTSNRVDRIVAEYGVHPVADWLAALDRIAGRLGEPVAAVRSALTAGDPHRAVSMLLAYYDRGYAHRPAPTGPLLGVVGPGSAEARTASAVLLIHGWGRQVDGGAGLAHRISRPGSD
jgi:hypothetical protein